jgi:hypothetical protein
MQETSMKQAGNKACLAYSSTLKMDAICSSETSVDFHLTTQRYIPEDVILDFYSWNLIHSLRKNMTPESRNSSLLSNGSVNTFPRKRTLGTIEERCFLWSAPPALLRNGEVNVSLLQ